MEATISADIIRSTSLPSEGMVLLQERLAEFVDFLRNRFTGCWGRVVRGDGLECVISDAHFLLRIVLLLKCHIKAIKVSLDEIGLEGGNKRFFQFGVRMAVAVGSLRTNNQKLGIIDGDAIYKSGRALDNMGVYDVFNITSVYKATEPIVKSLFLLINHILRRASSRQCQVLFMKLQGMSDSDIAMHMSISRIGVYLHLKSIGWEAINAALDCYEHMCLDKGGME